jgi:hypothetical protein
MCGVFLALLLVDGTALVYYVAFVFDMQPGKVLRTVASMASFRLDNSNRAWGGGGSV